MINEDFYHRFSGIGRLYGREALERFSQAHLMIIGLGGVGSWTAESLARSGVGAITLVDLDDVCITNTNRQIHAIEGNYGKQKTEILAERVRQINPDCLVHAETLFYSKKNAETLLSRDIDLVIDSIDGVISKSHLLAECRKRELPVISCGGAGGRRDLTRIKVSDLSRTSGDKLASSVRTELRKYYGFPKGKNKESKKPMKPKKFNIPIVYSDEEMIEPKPCSLDPEENNEVAANSPRSLNCATGYGAVTHVTAAFGLTLAQLALEHLLEGTKT